SVVIPTYNERDNIVVLLDQLAIQLLSIKNSYEIIVVDDASPDGTAAVVEKYAENFSFVRLIQRTGKRDLSAALASGFDSAAGEFLVAMDADLQHDPAIILQMLTAASHADLVVATRYAAQGSATRWNGMRRFFSRVATGISVAVLRIHCSDPLSGYFLLRRDAWQAVRKSLYLSGFKLLLEILVAKPDLVCVEVGYCFAARQRGNSKFGAAAMLAFFLAVWRLWRRSL
ncbi:MAG TPA: polyprenol monophosphomannose synthase, partial [Pseudomonadales bacterium]|nr:polyprenol monophosphomannose synthase [Pseudomonadales bacterium]